jgi:hypothetical protein
MGKSKKSKEQVEVTPVVVQQESTAKPKKDKKKKAKQVNDTEVPLFSRDAAFALFNLFIYSFAMFTLPFASFFATKYILQDHFHVTGFSNTCASVIAAVLTVNLIIIMYAIKGAFMSNMPRDHFRSIGIFNMNILKLTSYIVGFQESVVDEQRENQPNVQDSKPVPKTNSSNSTENVSTKKKNK